jgi:hypothetical protein
MLVTNQCASNDSNKSTMRSLEQSSHPVTEVFQLRPIMSHIASLVLWSHPPHAHLVLLIARDTATDTMSAVSLRTQRIVTSYGVEQIQSQSLLCPAIERQAKQTSYEKLLQFIKIHKQVCIEF